MLCFLLLLCCFFLSGFCGDPTTMPSTPTIKKLLLVEIGFRGTVILGYETEEYVKYVYWLFLPRLLVKI